MLYSGGRSKKFKNVIWRYVRRRRKFVRHEWDDDDDPETGQPLSDEEMKARK